MCIYSKSVGERSFKGFSYHINCVTKEVIRFIDILFYLLEYGKKVTRKVVIVKL